MRLLRTAALLLVAGLAAAEAIAAPQRSVVVLPFESIAGADEAPDVIATLVAAGLASRGWRVVPPADVSELLEKERVRYLDSLDDHARGAIVAATGVDAVLSGAVFSYSEGRNPSFRSPRASFARTERSSGATSRASLPTTRRKHSASGAGTW